MNAYAQRVYEQIQKRDAHEPEFLQAVGEVLTTLTPMLDQHPEYEKLGLLERITEPERIVQFRVPWVDDAGQVRVKRLVDIVFPDR